jgi:hypothetical protein
MAHAVSAKGAWGPIRRALRLSHHVRAEVRLEPLLRSPALEAGPESRRGLQDGVLFQMAPTVRAASKSPCGAQSSSAARRQVPSPTGRCSQLIP